MDENEAMDPLESTVTETAGDTGGVDAGISVPVSDPPAEPEPTEPIEEASPMFEDTAPQSSVSTTGETAQGITTSAVEPTSTPIPDAETLGQFAGATIQVIDGTTVRVVLPGRVCSNTITEIPVPIAAAALLALAANPAFESAKTLLPA